MISKYIKSALLLALILMTSMAFSQQPGADPAVQETGKIKWVTIEEAQKLQAKNPKKIMIDVYTSWCGPCRMMDNYTFSNPEVIKYVNENFYAVKFNAEGGDPVKLNGKDYNNPGFRKDFSKHARNATHQLTLFLKVRGYPTVVFLGEQLKNIGATVGFRKAEQFLPILKSMKEKT